MSIALKIRNYIVILIVLVLLTGCTKKHQIEKEENKLEEVTEIESYIDDNPISIGIYENDINLVKEVNLKKQIREEIILSFYYTDIENLGNRYQKENWNKFYSMYTNIDDYKIGFNFSFYVGDTKIEKTVLKPEIFAFEPYFYIYLYDDINQIDNTFYSHLEESDVTERTIFSSIKIFLMEPYNITSPIKFTVFTYNDMEDFDENNNYRGNSKYEININLV